MISLQEYNQMSAGEKKDYLDSLSPADKEQFFHRMKAASPSPASQRGDRVISYSVPAASAASATGSAARREISPPWTRPQMGLMVCWILFFPLTGLLFFLASSFKDATREQGFTLLRFTFVYLFLLVVACFALNYYYGEEAAEIISSLL